MKPLVNLCRGKGQLFNLKLYKLYKFATLMWCIYKMHILGIKLFIVQGLNQGACMDDPAYFQINFLIF